MSIPGWHLGDWGYNININYWLDLFVQCTSLNTFNNLSPLKSCKVSLSYSVSWFTPAQDEDCWSPAKVSQQENLLNCTCITAYKDHVSNYKEALNKAKTTYCSAVVAKGQVNPRTLFLTVNKLLLPAKQLPLTASIKLCCDFMDFFQCKIISIYQQLHYMVTKLNVISTPSPSKPLHLPVSCFSAFSAVDTLN